MSIMYLIVAEFPTDHYYGRLDANLLIFLDEGRRDSDSQGKLRDHGW
jgi:hypothetical protein